MVTTRRKDTPEKPTEGPADEPGLKRLKQNPPPTPGNDPVSLLHKAEELMVQADLPLNKSGALNPYKGLDGIKVGDVAPDFTLKAETGVEVSLKALRGKFVLIYWFNDPEDPVVKVGGAAFAEAFPAVSVLGAQLLFVGPASPEQGQKLVEEGLLPFPVLLDEDKTVSKLYNNISKDGNVMRTSVLLDTEGKVLSVMADIPVEKVTVNPFEAVAFLKAYFDLHQAQAVAAVQGLPINKSGTIAPYKGLDGIMVGDVAPDFTLKDQEGREVTLSSFVGKFVLLYWFNDPEDPVVKKGGAAFAQAFAQLAEMGSELLFLGPAGQEHCKKLVEEGQLPFPVLADANKDVAKLYNNIDKDGNVMRTTVLVDME